MKKIIVISVLICNTSYSQKKDTIFFILNDINFAKSVNDTLIFDNNLHRWIDKNLIGTFKYPDKNIGWDCLGTAIRDTILVGENRVTEYFKISKKIYPDNLWVEKEKIRSFLKVVDSCDNIYPNHSTSDSLNNFIVHRKRFNENISEKYKCYNSSLSNDKILISPYIFWRNDSGSGMTIFIDSIKIQNKGKVPIYTNSRTYFTKEEINNICNNKKNNTKCYNDYFGRLNFDSLEDLDLRDYIIFINEDNISDFNDDTNDKKILFNEYYFNKSYHKYSF